MIFIYILLSFVSRSHGMDRLCLAAHRLKYIPALLLEIGVCPLTILYTDLNFNLDQMFHNFVSLIAK